MFKSLPYSQFRRAVVICSDPTNRLEAVNYMYDKFVKCGYSEEELNSAKETALSLNREQILGITPSTQSPVNLPPPSVAFTKSIAYKLSRDFSFSSFLGA